MENQDVDDLASRGSVWWVILCVDANDDVMVEALGSDPWSLADDVTPLADREADGGLVYMLVPTTHRVAADE